MNFTMDIWIALVVGMALGFILCAATTVKSALPEDPRDTGPHKE